MGFLKYKKEIDLYIENYFKSLPQNKITEAMSYSMNSGGKRVRGSLALMSGNMFDGAREDILDMALAIEMIHTYSLIHDDLPSMDNDILRRGMKTSHVVFGEAMAILSGDALLNEAFTVMIGSYGLKSKNGSRAALLMSKASGRDGMILGQVLDLENEEKDASYDELLACHNKKTGELISISLVAPAVYLGASDKEIEKIKDFGIKLGLVFQIQDDILDSISTEKELGKTIGKDKKMNKTTYVSLFGVEKSREIEKELIEDCIDILKQLDRDTREIEEFVYFLEERNY